MALLKFLKGNASSLPNTSKEGWIYVTQDTADMHIFKTDSERIHLNANYANKLRENNTLNTGLNVGGEDTPVYFLNGVPKEATKITDSNKMNKNNPTGTGSLSLNRKANTTIGDRSIAIGSDTTASGVNSFASGGATVASGQQAHAEGLSTTASGFNSHAEGYNTSATAYCAHSEGAGSHAQGQYSHVEGSSNFAIGESSHAEGDGTTAASDYQHTQGKYNIQDANSIYAHIVGNGDAIKNSNAHTLDWDGNAWFAGDVYVDSTSGTNKDNGSVKLIRSDDIASDTKAGLTIVYPEAKCTTFTSDMGTATPKAIQKAAEMFAITRPPKRNANNPANPGTAGTCTPNNIVRWLNAAGDVQDSKITIEDVTNTKDSSKKANVLAIPAEGGKKMVYGYCTDQVDGTSFIGGVFPADATEYPYASGLAIGGTSGNLLWKGKQVATIDDTISNASKVKVTATSTQDQYIYLTGVTSANTNDSASLYVTAGSTTSSGPRIEPNSKALYGAVWNDYAECRETKEDIKPGRVVCETGKGDLVLSTERLQAGANIVSDTFGFIIGETSKAKTPIAVSGRALAYPLEDRILYAAGDAVCAGPNGTVSKMTREEIREYPDRILGTVSEIPDYEIWGENNIIVDGRIWIKVR